MTIGDYKQVSEMLGHSTVAFTMKINAHVTPASQDAVVRAIADCIRAEDPADVVKLSSNDN